MILIGAEPKRIHYIAKPSGGGAELDSSVKIAFSLRAGTVTGAVIVATDA